VHNLLEMKICVIGLGYVGLPLALELANEYDVIGFDINPERIDQLSKGYDKTNEISSDQFANKNIQYTAEIEKAIDSNLYIVAVPTPVNNNNIPELIPLEKATETVCKVLKPGDIVVYESTVFPGCTEEFCVPIIEKITGLKLNKDFSVGYSPERINPGDKVNTIRTITKVVSASNHDALETLSNVYGDIIDAGVYKANSIKVAEAAKVIENTQRDINIALMNELAMIFDKLNINTKEVIAAASTKWNFLKFYPGLVGGHCIGVDPYYLTYKAQEVDHDPFMILSGRKINNYVPQFIVNKILQNLSNLTKTISELNILVRGVTFKENVSDIRNSKVFDLISILKSYGFNVQVEDCLADPDEVKDHYGVVLTSNNNVKYDVFILAVNHTEYSNYSVDEILNLVSDRGVFFDIKSIYSELDLKNQITYLNL